MRVAVRIFACFAAACLFAQSDDEAIRSLVRRYMDARESQDATAVGALFTADADQLVSSGEWRKGRDELVKGTLASSRNTTGKRTIAVSSIRHLAPGVAIADGPYEIGERKMWTCFVVVKSGSEWKIAAIRNMLPAR